MRRAKSPSTRLVRIAALAGLVVGVALLAPAQEPRRIGAASATSACIGDNATPRCAAETFLACMVRQTAALCARVGVALRQVPRAENRLIEYVIERDSVITAAQITEELREVEWFKPGFTLVEIRVRGCPSDCAGEAWENLQVYLSQQPAGWRVVAWRIDGEAEEAPELPEEFRPKGP